MSDQKIRLSILLIDDDEDYLKLIPKSVGNNLDDMELSWDCCKTFEDGLAKLSKGRYDAVISDLYEGKPETKKAAGVSIVDQIRGKQFCPILLVSAGTRPEGLKLSAFVDFAEKAKEDEIEKAITTVLKVLPRLVRKLHNEIDSHGESYLWQHLDKEWDLLKELVGNNPELLERLIRKRLAVQMSRLMDAEGKAVELKTVKGLEFYLYPSIAGDEFRLGDILRKKGSSEFRVILTPHCQLTVQPGDERPRAVYVLTVKTEDAKKIWAENVSMKEFPKPTAVERYESAFRRRIQPVPLIGDPEGRYWFLPAFLAIPDLYCDFLQVESVKFDDLKRDYDQIATLDTPFAECLQSCFANFYSSVGIPNLKGTDYFHLKPEEVVDAQAAAGKESAQGKAVQKKPETKG